MYKQKKSFLWAIALMLLMLVACSAATESTTATQTTTVVNTSSTAITSNGKTAVSPTPITIDEAAASHTTSHEDAGNYFWDESQVTTIVLAGDSIAVEGSGVSVDGRTATITRGGAYELSGSLSEGQIVVDSEDKTAVQLIFNGINVSHSSTAPLYVANAAETIIILAEGSQNSLTDGANYIFASAEEDEPNAALFSKDDLTIYGQGSLTVTGNYNDAITSKDGLIIASGNITVTAVDDGIRGKEYLIIKGGSLTITSGGDGLKSDEDKDAALGYITIEGGSLTITSGGDAIQAATDVLIRGGDFNLTAGGGSSASLAADLSAKGIKATAGVYINGGAFTINSADDAIHANNNIVINNGTFAIATGDDGMHADANLEINGGVIHISQSYEGLESAVITLNGGDIHIVSSDDGINVAGGNDGSGFGGPGFGGPGGGGRPPRGGGQDTFTPYSGDYYLYINGGTIVVEASGDGLDANGAIVMTGGTVIVNGPTEQMNGALDYDGTFTMTGGLLVAAGSAGMAQAPDVSSTQNALLLNLNGTLPAGTLIHIEDSSGNAVLTFAPSKAYQSLAFSSPELVRGETYTVYYGGTDSGTLTNNLYSGGSYSGGAEYTSFTVASTVTMIGNARLR